MRVCEFNEVGGGGRRAHDRERFIRTNAAPALALTLEEEDFPDAFAAESAALKSFDLFFPAAAAAAAPDPFLQASMTRVLSALLTFSTPCSLQALKLLMNLVGCRSWK